LDSNAIVPNQDGAFCTRLSLYKDNIDGVFKTQAFVGIGLTLNKNLIHPGMKDVRLYNVMDFSYLGRLLLDIYNGLLPFCYAPPEEKKKALCLLLVRILPNKESSWFNRSCMLYKLLNAIGEIDEPSEEVSAEKLPEIWATAQIYGCEVILTKVHEWSSCMPLPQKVNEWGLCDFLNDLYETIAAFGVSLDRHEVFLNELNQWKMHWQLKKGDNIVDLLKTARWALSFDQIDIRTGILHPQLVKAPINSVMQEQEVCTVIDKYIETLRSSPDTFHGGYQQTSIAAIYSEFIWNQRKPDLFPLFEKIRTKSTVCLFSTGKAEGKSLKWRASFPEKTWLKHSTGTKILNN
jgi:hypothetical protein